MGNPRMSNGSERRKIARWLRSLGKPCAICGQPINYDLPARHPLSFEIDEDKPVSRWKEFGYASPTACALDRHNVHATHRRCNQMKSNLTLAEFRDKMSKNNAKSSKKPLISSRNWFY